MLEELHTASSLLCAALDRYLQACSALESGLSHKHLINKVVELSDIMDNEMGLVESYKSKLTQARVAVRRARNNQARVPVNSLPPEVLTQVFHLLVSDEATNEFYFPRYPETLSHVCSRWRQIALGCSELWSRIDIILSCSRSEGSHDRAEVHASRARQVPLDVRFLDPGDIGKSINSDDGDGYASEQWTEAMWDSNPDTFYFLASPSSRIRSLRLVVDDRYHPIHSRALEHCFANCLPGGLSELAISVQTSLDGTFFQTRASLEDRDTTELVISEQVLERVLSSITVLQLEGMYFPWTSAAYHGLTVLRLHCREDITISELTNILKSSPGLRIIQCSFSIMDSLSLSTSATPVALPELEILELDGMPIENAECFMRLLDPGLKPLRLSLRGNPTSAMLQAFYARSNVQELSTRQDFMTTRQQVLFSPKAFYLHPQLRVLIMRSWIWGEYLLDEEETPPARLDTVYMLRCYYPNADLFRTTVMHFSPRRLVLWDCHVGNSRRTELSVFQSVLGKDLCQPCNIEFLTSEDPNPVLDWT